MQYFTTNISSVILLVLALSGIFRLAHTLTTIFLKNKQLKNRIDKLLLFTELLIWLLLLYRIAENLKQEKPILALIAAVLLLLIILWAFLYFLKDYFAGLYFRIFENYQINDYIRFNNQNGIITEFKSRCLVLDSKQGSLQIPYSNLYKHSIIRLSEQNEKELIIELMDKSENLSEEYIDNLRKKILLMPWINPNYLPEIKRTDKENKKLSIKIILLDTQYKNKAENYLKQEIKSI